MQPLLLFAITFFASLSATAKTLVVGEALRFEDRYNGTISYFDKGCETARSLFEKDHPGVKIKVKRFPHDEKLQTVAEAAKHIIASKIPAVVGGEISAEAKTFGDVLNPQKVVFMSYTASSPIVSENKPYVFRAGFADEQVAKALAKYVFEKVKPKKLGIFTNISNPYSTFLSEQFQKATEELARAQGNPASIAVQKVISGVDDYSKNVDYFKKESVTHLVSFVVDSNFTNLVVQAGRKDFFPVYIGSDSWGSNKYIFSRHVENSSNKGRRFVALRTYYWKEDAHGPLEDRFVREFKRKFHEPPNAWNAVAFDAAWILFTAMNNAKDPGSAEKIRSELLKIKNMKLLTSDSFMFGENNGAIKDLPVYKLSQAGIEFQGKIR